jgi:predicted P-loop ATPase
MLADIARQTSYDPVLDWIDGCVWDGKPRLVTWLHQACGTPLDPYHQAIGRNVIGGIVKRARHPGTKHDEVMILIGKQGCGKSELTKAVAGRPEWHTDSVAFEGRPQDIIPQLHGKLVIELSELDGMHKREAGHIKRFLSTQTDNYTAKYDAFANDHARRCIFIGTCNLEHPLVDDTGGRRFYPVRIPAGTRINIAWLRENLDQLIGEAAALDAAGETFGIPESVWAAAAVVQETARTVSAVEELVLQWFTKPDTPGGSGYFVLSSDIVAALTMARQNANAKVGATMKRLGYVHDRPYINGVQTRAWIKSHEGSVAGCVQLVPAQNITGGRVEMRVRSGLP